MIYNILSFEFTCRNPRNAHARTLYKGLKHNKVTKSTDEKQIFRPKIERAEGDSLFDGSKMGSRSRSGQRVLPRAVARASA